MPVLIIGATSDVGRSLAGLLRAEDAQVRAYVRQDDADLRSMGCKVAVGLYDDLGRMESAMEQVHTVVNLAAEEDPPFRLRDWSNQETTDVALIAARSADVMRFLALSELHASPTARDEYLRARGTSDDLVRSSGLQFAILRCAPILGAHTPLGEALRRARDARVATSLSPGSQRMNPIGAGDVARALLLADSRGAAVNGEWDIGGNEGVSFDELVTRVTRAKRIQRRKSVPGIPRAIARTWSRDRIADSRDFAEQFGWAPGSLDDAIKASGLT
ncbi:MAG: SDR family oxidoreductase [Actinomycetota bacterium]|nr:NAD(P)H-binding protein [Actinomycetota bacterium]